MTTIAPPPTPAPPPPLSAGGRTAIRVVLILAAALITLGGVVTVGGVAVGVSTMRAITDTRTLPAYMRALTVDMGDVPARVRVTADPGAVTPRVDLRLVRSTSSGDAQLDVSTDAAGTRVSFPDNTEPRFLDWARAADINVVLPPATAPLLRLTVEQRVGMLAAQADLDELVARSANGVIVLGGSARNVEVNTQNGSIETTSPITVSESFVANTTHGPINVEFASAPPTVEAVSRDGDVTVELPADIPYRVRAQSGRSTAVAVPETNDPAAPQVTARSDDGDVTIEPLD